MRWAEPGSEDEEVVLWHESSWTQVLSYHRTLEFSSTSLICSR